MSALPSRAAIAAFATLALLTAPPALAQSAPLAQSASAATQLNRAVPLTFEAVSIRRNPAPMGPATARFDFPADGDGLVMTDIVLSSIVGSFYDHFDASQSGIPAWARDECYDIRAKVAPSDLAAYHALTKADRKRMVQAMLEDRFKLRVHTEQKEAPVYDLTIARGGPKLKQAVPGETYASGPTRPDGKSVGSGLFMTPEGEVAQAISLDAFARSLSQSAGRQVVDKTGLTGRYDFTFQWSHNLTDSEGLSLFTALEEQLGLKLEPARGTVETLVVDHIERPSEN